VENRKRGLWKRTTLSLLLSSPPSPGKEGVTCSRKAGTPTSASVTGGKGDCSAEGAGKRLDWLSENAWGWVRMWKSGGLIHSWWCVRASKQGSKKRGERRDTY
jgi:hypothetical protein